MNYKKNSVASINDLFEYSNISDSLFVNGVCGWVEQ